MGVIIGDFKELEEKVLRGEMSQEEFQKIFEKARFHGLDDSVYPFAVGGSDAAIILGESAFSTPLKLYYEKTGKYEEVKDTESEIILYKGHVFETPFREVFTKKTGIQTYPYYKQTKSEEFPHCVANIDGLAVIDGELFIYEGKTTQSFKYQNLFRKGEAPIPYIIQTQFYMEVIDRIDEEVLSEVDPALPYLLDDFEVKGAIINCGWGIADNDMKHVFIARNKGYGRDILDACESFVIDAENGRPPTNDNVLDLSLLKRDEYANYGEINKSLPPIVLSKRYLPVFENIDEIDIEAEKIRERLVKERDKEIAAIEEKYKPLEDSLKELEKAKEELLLPFIDEIKEGTKGILETDDFVYEVLYDGETKSRFNAAVKKRFKENYPEVYDEVMSYARYNKRELKYEKRRK